MQKVKLLLVLFSIVALVVPFAYSISVNCGQNNVCGSSTNCTCVVSDCEEGYLDIYTSERDIKPVQEFTLGLGSNKYTIDSSVVQRGSSIMLYKLVCVQTQQNYPATAGKRGPFSVGGGGAVGNLSGRCFDGTAEGECSTNKPFLCEGGKLVKDCVKCKCKDGECNSNTGSCEVEPVEPSGPVCGDGICDPDEANCPSDCKKKGISPVLLISLVLLFVLLFVFRKKFSSKFGKGGEGPVEILEGKTLVPTFKMPDIKIPKDDEKKSRAIETLRKQAEALRAMRAAKQTGGGAEAKYKYPYGKDEKSGEPNFKSGGNFGQ